LGFSLARSSQESETKEILTKALHLAPNDPDILMSVINCFIVQKHYQDALTILNHQLRINPSYAVYWGLGNTYDELGQLYKSNSHFLKAIENYKIAIQMSSEYRALFYYELGTTYLHMGDKGSALNVYRVIKGFGKKYEYDANRLFEAIYK
jgi:tetratricopeptide (TPR) repeat protein